MLEKKVEYLGIEIGVQQHIAGLQVQVEQGGGQIVEEVYTQSHLMSQSKDQWPGRWSMQRFLIRSFP